MNQQSPRKGLKAVVLALASICLVSGAATAVTYSIKADYTTVLLPDGVTSVDMWGYGFAPDGLDSCSTGGFPTDVHVPGPLVVVPPGDSLTVDLYNCLTEETSLVIPGQPMPTGGPSPVWTDGSSGARSSETQRVRSLTHEAGPSGTATYTWATIEPGTYLYESGTHQARQVSMGLYGALKKDYAVSAAYDSPNAGYTDETIVVWSEIDPFLHSPVTTPNPVNYQPSVFPVHTYDGPGHGALPVPFTRLMPDGDPHLVRMLNAGLMTRVPVLYGEDSGVYLKLIAEDGNLYPYPRAQASALLSARKTLDAILDPSVSGSYALADRRLFVSATKSNQAPVAMDDDAVVDELMSVVIAVLGNDFDPDGDSFDITPSSGSGDALLGTFDCTAGPAQCEYTSTGGTGTDTFMYEICDTPGGLCDLATVSVEVVNDGLPPMAHDQSLATELGTPLSITLTATDEAPAALIYSIVDLPMHGGLSVLSGGPPAANTTYTPDPGFRGVDSFTFEATDGSFTSNLATVTILVGEVLLLDDFEGSGPVVGPALVPTTPWFEFPASGDAVELLGGELHFKADGTLLAAAHELVAPQITGQMIWEFDFDFTHDATTFETYYLTMELLDDDQPGFFPAPVSLEWGRLGGIEATLAYSDGGGSTALAAVSGFHRISVIVDLDASVYSVRVDGALVGPSSIPLSSALVGGISDAAFWGYMSSEVGSGRSFDNTIIVGSASEVLPVAPGSLDQALTTPEEVPLGITLLGTSPTAPSGLLPPESGVLSGAGDTWTFTPSLDWNGIATFTYSAVEDSPISISITVTPVNDAPVALNQLHTTGLDTPFPITGPTFFMADDADGDTLTYLIADAPSHGDLVGIVGDGISPLTYVPDLGYRGLDSFTFVAFDGTAPSNVGTVTISVGRDVLLWDDFNRADDDLVGPALVPALGWVEFEDAFDDIRVLGEEMDFNKKPPTSLYTLAYQELDVPQSSGRILWEFDFDWTTDPGGEGLPYDVFMDLTNAFLEPLITLEWVTSLDYTESILASVDASYTRTRLTALSGSHRVSVEADLDQKLYSVRVDGVLLRAGIPMNTGAYGDQIALAAFSAYIDDGVSGGSFDDILVVGGLGPDNPALDRSVTTSEDLLSPTITLGGGGPSWPIINPPANGVLSGGGNALNYMPNADFNGVDSFTYSDEGGLGVGLVSITVNPVNDRPVAGDDAASTPANLAVSISLLDNDTDVDGDTVVFGALDPPTYGSFVCDTNGLCVYWPETATPPYPAYPYLDTFNYYINDGVLSDTGTVTVEVTAPATATLLLDGFNRPEGSPGAVGNQWDEVESPPGSEVALGSPVP